MEGFWKVFLRDSMTKREEKKNKKKKYIHIDDRQNTNLKETTSDDTAGIPLFFQGYRVKSFIYI